MKTLVIGGTGNVGSLIVAELLRRDQAVRVLVTSAEKAEQLPAGVQFTIGNMEDPGTLPKAFADVDRVFLLNRQSHTEAAQGQYVVAAAKRAGVHKIVYQSIHDARKGPHIPHFRPKITIENAIQQAGLNYTFICPNNFYQNDLWFANAIVNQGLYTQPIGSVGLNRVDIRDIAEASVNALLSDEWNGQSIPLVGPDSLTGQDTARILTDQLGFPVRYANDDMALFAAQIDQWVPAWIIDDWTHMYHFFQNEGLVASADDLALVTKLLGRSPRSYSEFIADHAQVFSPALEMA
ncbi:SDR family oxidoreductase [Spirosoma koreense]